MFRKEKIRRSLTGLFLLLLLPLSHHTLAASCPADYSAASNVHGGFHNAALRPATSAFAALKSDGSISAWGSASYGGDDAPTDSGYISISSNGSAFAALRGDGSISTWGNASSGGANAPTDSGYVSISSTITSFAALKADGSIRAWGGASTGGTGAPIDAGYNSISSNFNAFAALKDDGSIRAWGNADTGGAGAPIDDGYISISSNYYSFAALKSDGSISVWGLPNSGGGGAPTDSGYVSIVSNDHTYAALKADGSISAWGSNSYGATNAPTDNGFLSISSTANAFAALKADGTISTWGDNYSGGTGAPTASGFILINSNDSAFAALRGDGTISAWGDTNSGGAGAPTDSGYVSISSSREAFAALKADGSISAWGDATALGDASSGGDGAPTDNGYVSISSSMYAFAALKADGSISAWGDESYGGDGAPTDDGYVSINNRGMTVNSDCPSNIAIELPVIDTAPIEVNAEEDAPFSYTLPQGTDSGNTLTRNALSELPDWLSFDAGTSTLSGTPDNDQVGSISVMFRSVDSNGSLVQESLVIAVKNVNDAPILAGSLSDISSSEAAPFSFTLPFSDSDSGDSLTYSVPGLPDWLSLDSNAGLLSGTPQKADAGLLTLTVRATDNSGEFVEQSLLITVNEHEICPADVNAAFSDHGGYYNASFTPARYAFAALTTDGSISAWGDASYGGDGVPIDSGYVSISPNQFAFAALKADGSISAWGDASYGGDGAPIDSGYVSISSNNFAFAALKADGSISAWGDSGSGGNNAPIDSGYITITSTGTAFAALKADGSISAWGNASYGGNEAPTNSGYVSISSNHHAFSALKSDGSISSWGYSQYGGTGEPTDNDYVSISSTSRAFAALKADGSISAWGLTSYASTSAPTEKGYVSISSNDYAFAALKVNGSISTWGDRTRGGTNAPVDSGYVSISSTSDAFAALKSDGSISAWGMTSYGDTGAPTDDGFTSISSNSYAFAALRADGSISAWGEAGNGGDGAPSGTGYISISSNDAAFAALKEDGSISAWGNARYGGTGAPTGRDYVSINNRAMTVDSNCSSVALVDVHTLQDEPFLYTIQPGTDSGYVAVRNLPDWLSFDVETSTLSGTPGNEHVGLAIVPFHSFEENDLLTQDSIVIAVDNANDAPILASTQSAYYAKKGAPFSLRLPFTDEDADDSLIFSASGLPDWLSLDSSTGVLSGTPMPTDLGLHTITARATDSVDAFVEYEFSTKVVGYIVCPADYTAAFNDYGGSSNAPFQPNMASFAALKADGSISAWGGSGSGGAGAPTDSGYVSITSNLVAFAALRVDGSISAWGDADSGGDGAPLGNGYVSISSNLFTFAALWADGSIRSWGNASGGGGEGAPIDSGYVSISSNSGAFAALKADGSISAWGAPNKGGNNAPTDNGYVLISSNQSTFAALKADGSITVWGNVNQGATEAPADSGYVSIISNHSTFAALKSDGSISAWGHTSYGGEGAPAGNGYVAIKSTQSAFAALRGDGSISVWGDAYSGGTGAPTDSGYVSISSNDTVFVAMKADGSITAWGDRHRGGEGAPTDSGYISLSSNQFGFAALKADGSISVWGDAYSGGDDTPLGNGYVSISSSQNSFAALTANGSIKSWGSLGGVSVPTDNGYVSINNRGPEADPNCIDWNAAPTVSAAPVEVVAVEDATFIYKLPQDSDVGEFTTHRLWSELPNWLSFDASTGTLSGTPGNAQVGSHTLNFRTSVESGELVREPVVIAVTNVNDDPLIAGSLPVLSINEDDPFSYTLPSNIFFDTDIGDNLTLSVLDLHDWLSFDSSTLVLSGTPRKADFGLNEITVRATDSAGSYVDQPLQIAVMPSPICSAGASGYSNVSFRNNVAFAALKADGSISAWGNASYGGEGAPADSGYITISSNDLAFAALKADGSISAWGYPTGGGSGAPTDSGYFSIKSTENAFAALNFDGRISSWGMFRSGSGVYSVGDSAPTDSGYALIHPNQFAFAALKTDGSISAWGNASHGGTGAPPDNGYHFISATSSAFAALNSDGYIRAWGYASSGGAGAPTDSGYVSISSNQNAFAALKADGSISAWGNAKYGAVDAPTDSGYVYIRSAGYGFFAMRDDGSISAWGTQSSGAYGAPTDNGYVSITSNGNAYAALKADGSISVWGNAGFGGAFGPTDSGYVSITSAGGSFIALKADGSISVWGGSDEESALTDNGYVSIISNGMAYAALKADGSISAWGDAGYGGSDAPTDKGYVSINNQGLKVDSRCQEKYVINLNMAPTISAVLLDIITAEDAPFSFSIPLSTFADSDVEDSLSISVQGLPDWLSFDSSSRVLSGTPEQADLGLHAITVRATDNANEFVEQTLQITVVNVNDTPTVVVEIASQSADQDDNFSFNVPEGTFVDTDTGESLALSAIDLPDWLSFDAATGTLSGTPGNGQVGSATVVLQAVDSSGALVQQSFEITVNNVNDAPQLSITLPDMDIDEGSPFSLTIPSSTFIDADVGDTLILSVSDLPNWLVFDSSSDVLSGTPSQDDVGTYTIIVKATDASGLTVENSFALVVADVNDMAPVFSSVDTVEVAENTFGAVHTLTVDDADADDTASFTLGGDDAAQFKLNEASGELSLVQSLDFEAPADADADGVYQLNVTVSDAVGNSTSQALGIRVSNVDEAPVVAEQTLQIDEFAEVGSLLGTLVGQDPEAATLRWSLISQDSPFVLGASGALSLAAPLDFESKAEYALSVQVNDGTFSTQATVQVNVTNAFADQASIWLQVEQDGQQVQQIRINGGLVSVAAIIANPVPGLEVGYAWEESSKSLLNRITSTEPANDTLTFSPSGLSDVDEIVARVAVTRDGVRSENDLVLPIAAPATTAEQTIDSDGDGILDIFEGDLDASASTAVANRLQTVRGDDLSYVMESEAGTVLRLGSVARAAKRDQGQVSIEDLVSHLPGATMAMVIVNVPDGRVENISEVFDFEVANMATVGESVRVVLPLQEPLAAGAQYMKFHPATGWRVFASDAANGIRSAPPLAGIAGQCLSPGDAGWSNGLVEGHTCIELSIKDGGINDDDSFDEQGNRPAGHGLNGNIRDPGGIINLTPVAPVTPVTPSPEVQNPPLGAADESGGGGGQTGLWLLMILTCWLGCRVGVNRHIRYGF